MSANNGAKHRPAIKVREVRNDPIKIHVSNFIITVNMNNRHGDESLLTKMSDELFSEEYWSDHLSDLITLKSKEGLDAIDEIEISKGNIETMKTRSNSPHIHMSVIIKHRTLIHINLRYLKTEIKKIVPRAYVNLKFHADYSEVGKNYIAKTA